MKTIDDIIFPHHKHPVLDGTETEMWFNEDDVKAIAGDYASLRVEEETKQLTETNRQLVEALDNQYYFLLRIAGSQNLTDPARKEVNENIIAVQNLLSQFNKEEKV